MSIKTLFESKSVNGYTYSTDKAGSMHGREQNGNIE